MDCNWSTFLMASVDLPRSCAGYNAGGVFYIPSDNDQATRFIFPGDGNLVCNPSYAGAGRDPHEDLQNLPIQSQVLIVWFRSIIMSETQFKGFDDLLDHLFFFQCDVLCEHDQGQLDRPSQVQPHN